jgi:serine protease Do
MSDYCDVLRTAGEGRPMTVEVLRYDTGEVLRGEINGDTPIEVIFSPADEIKDEVDATPTGGAATYSGYQTLYDDTDTITIDVPREWDDIDGSSCSYDGGTIPCLSASPDLDGFRETYGTSGVFYALYPGSEDLDELLDIYAPGDCVDGGIYEYEDVVYAGIYQIWEDCGPVGSYTIVLAAVPEDQSYTALLWSAVVVEADWEALDKAFATFYKLP